MNRWRGLIEGFGVALLFTALTVPMFYPISVHPGSMLFDRWDGCLHTWILAWDIHKLTTGLAGFFDANIFWPHKDALAYSDHLIGSAILVAPIYLITGNPLLAENAVGILGFILSGLGMYLLVRRFVPGRAAAIVAGLIFAYCPWRYGQLGHQSQLTTGQWMPFALLFLHRTMENQRWRDALLFGLFFTFQALCSFYLAAIMGTAAATLFIVELISRKGLYRNRAVWTRLAVVGALSLAIIVPTMIPYYRVQKSQGLERTELECIQLSADPLDYFAAPPWNRLYGWTYKTFESRLSPFPNENWLFPGILATLLAVTGIFRLSTGVAPARPLKKRFEMRFGLEWEHAQGVYLILAATALILSFGPEFHFYWKLTPIPLPYKLFYHIVPGFKALRVPSRFAYLLMLAMSVLAAYGYRNIERRIGSAVGRYALALLVSAGILAESFSSPLPNHPLPTGDAIPAVYKWLALQPADAVVAELPQYLDIPSAPKGSYDPLDFTCMYFSIFHRFQPMINGRSGFIPIPQQFIWYLMLRFPSPESVIMLKYLGVQYVVLHTAEYPGDKGKQIAARADALDSEFKLEGVFGADRVYRLLNPAPATVREKLEGLMLTEAYLPRQVSPKHEVEFMAHLHDGGPWPTMSFKLIDINAVVTETGPAGSRTFRQSQKLNIYMVPGQSRALIFQLKSPAWDGSYRWSIQIKFPDYPHLNRTFSFDLEVGNFPDSSKPGTLRAEFLGISAPSTLSAGEVFNIEARVKNAGDTLWRAHPRDGAYDGIVMLGIRDWHTPDKKRLSVQPKVERGYLDKFVTPGEDAVVRIQAWAPDAPGLYLIQLDMVVGDEHSAWFADRGSQFVWLPIEVRER